MSGSCSETERACRLHIAGGKPFCVMVHRFQEVCVFCVQTFTPASAMAKVNQKMHSTRG